MAFLFIGGHRFSIGTQQENCNQCYCVAAQRAGMITSNKRLQKITNNHLLKEFVKMGKDRDFSKRINFAPSDYDAYVLSEMSKTYPHLDPPGLLRQSLFSWETGRESNSKSEALRRIEYLLVIAIRALLSIIDRKDPDSGVIEELKEAVSTKPL